MGRPDRPAEEATGPPDDQDHGWLVPLLILFVAKGLLLVSIIGPFTGHDEVDHFYYVARLADGDWLGEVGVTALPAAAEPYRAYVADYPHNAEVIQPPLYHLSLASLLLVAPGTDRTALYLLRIVAVALGTIVVWLSYRTARLIFPDDFAMRAAVPICVAFQPQFSFEAAIVNHDILVILLSTLALYLTLDGLKHGFKNRDLVKIGLIGGAGLWTKASFGLVLPVVAAAVIAHGRSRRHTVRHVTGDLARACGLPLVVAMPWFIRSYALYGDPTGARRLRQIPGYGDQASSVASMVFSRVFWRGRLEDFWGNFGWRLIPYDTGTYSAIYIGWAVAAAGLAIFLGRSLIDRMQERPGSLNSFQWSALGLLTLWLLLLVGGVLYVGTLQFTQSRFAFPGMTAFAILSVFGYRQVLPRRSRPLIVPILLAALLVLTVSTSLRFVIPFYHGTSGTTVLTK